MLIKIPPRPPKFLLLLVSGLALVMLVYAGWHWFGKRQTAKPYTIGIILSPVELPEGQISVLKEIIRQKLRTINEQGGIDGHPLRALYMDDRKDEKILYKLVKETSRDPNLIAYIGGRGVARAKAIGPLLTQKQIPFLGRYVFTDLFQEYPTMYTASVGIKEADLVLKELLKAKAKRIGFIGQQDDLLSTVFLQDLEKLVSGVPELKISMHRFFPKNYDFRTAQNRQLADSLRNETDFLMLVSSPASGKAFFEFLHQSKVKYPVFMLAPDISLVDPTWPGCRAAEIFTINSFSIPGAQHSHLLEQVAGLKIAQNPTAEIMPQIFEGGRLVDYIGLLQEAALNNKIPDTLPIRSRINNGLKQFINGKRLYRGWVGDWYFTPEHAYAGSTQLAWKPRNQKMSVLAPVQYLRTDSSVEKRQVLYTSLNMVEINQVSDDDGTFYATFYLEVNSAQQFNFNSIDFTNSARNEINHEALVEARLIRSSKDSVGFKFYNNLYLVSGKFYFSPDLKDYPLDKQKFPIMLQASNPSRFFMVQPSQEEAHDNFFKSKGWIYKGHYMGYDQDIITSRKNFYGLRKNIFYYKFSFVYIMKRAQIDFFLKTLVPLLSILIITYFSVYIPHREFEALAGIQVTGLLSSIALYFSTYKPEMQYATNSDKIFIFTYIMITTLIGTSILLYVMHHKNNTLTRLMNIYQQYLFPVVVLGFTIYIRWF
jgi:hypothetical protein